MIFFAVPLAMANDSLVVESRATASLKLIGLLTLSLIFGRYAAEPNNFSPQKLGHCWEEGVYNGRTGERRAKLIIAAAAVTKKRTFVFSPSVGNRSSDTQRVFLAGLVLLACFPFHPSFLPSFLPPFASVVFLPQTATEPTTAMNPTRTMR